MPVQIKIAVVRKGSDRPHMIVEAGDCDISVIGDDAGRALLSPDMVLIDLEAPTRDMLEELALAERKTIDRAKGLSEQEAYAHLRRAAMDQGKKLGEIAQALLTAADLLK